MTNHNPLRLVSESILSEIRRAKERLESMPGYHLCNSQQKRNALRKEAIKHSVSIELAGYDTSTTKGKREKARERNRSEKNLVNALEWGLQNYPSELSEDFIREIGKRVDPEINSRGYRKDRVRVIGAMWSPPAPEKIEREMREFLFENSCLDNVIEKALHTHFHIARIHPFYDGNGRTARLVQNIMLESAGFPPAAVRESERLEYMQLLDEAIDSYRVAEGNLDYRKNARRQKLYQHISKPELSEKEREYAVRIALELVRAKMSSKQNEFYNFMALKIWDALRQEVDFLYHKRKNK